MSLLLLDVGASRMAVGGGNVVKLWDLASLTCIAELAAKNQVGAGGAIRGSGAGAGSRGPFTVSPIFFSQLLCILVCTNRLFLRLIANRVIWSAVFACNYGPCNCAEHCRVCTTEALLLQSVCMVLVEAAGLGAPCKRWRLSFALACGLC